MYKMIKSLGLASTTLATTLASTTLANLPKQFIKNAKMPVCKQCSFFVLHTVPKHKYDLGLCKKFGEKNILSGEIKYFLASANRNDTNRCGLSGIYYEKYYEKHY